MSLLAGPERWREKAVAARRLAQEKYDVSRMLRAYDDLYSVLLGRKARVSGTFRTSEPVLREA